MSLTLTVLAWIISHSNYMASLVRALFGMAVALGWSHLSSAQIGAIIVAVEVALNPFVEKNTVSKSRVGERIDAEVEKITGSGQYPQVK